MRFKILKKDADIKYYLKYGSKIAVVDMASSKDCKNIEEDRWHLASGVVEDA